MLLKRCQVSRWLKVLVISVWSLPFLMPSKEMVKCFMAKAGLTLHRRKTATLADIKPYKAVSCGIWGTNHSLHAWQGSLYRIQRSRPRLYMALSDWQSSSSHAKAVQSVIGNVGISNSTQFIYSFSPNPLTLLSWSLHDKAEQKL